MVKYSKKMWLVGIMASVMLLVIGGLVGGIIGKIIFVLVAGCLVLEILDYLKHKRKRTTEDTERRVDK